MTDQPRSEPTATERAEYRQLIRLKAWGVRYFELHHKITAWDTWQWVRGDVFGTTETPR